MQKISYLLMAILVLAVAVGCKSAPPPAEPKVQEPEAQYTIIDHKTKDFGGTIPDWVGKGTIEIEAMDKYKDFYVFIDDQVGKDLEGLKLWSRGFSIASEIARLVTTRVTDKFVGAAAGDKDELATYMEEVVKSLSEAQYSGARQEADFWVQRRKKSDETEDYRYLLLVTVPRDQIDDAIRRALEDADEKEKTEEKKTAIQRVKDAFENGLD
jgi:hypothetical protein